MNGIIDLVPTIEEWQLRRLLDFLAYERLNINKAFPGFFTKAYYIRAEGVDWVDVESRRVRVVKTMSRDELQRDHDVLFRIPHRAVQLRHNDKLLVIGFWCSNIKEFEKWLKEQLLDAYTLANSERLLIGQVPLAAADGTNVSQHEDEGLSSTDY